MKAGDSFSCSTISLYASLLVQVSPGLIVRTRWDVLSLLPILSMQQGHTQAPSLQKPPHLWILFKTTILFLFWFKTRPEETLYKLVPSDTLLNCASCLTPHLKASLHLWLTKHHTSISLHSLAFWHTLKSGRLFSSKYSSCMGPACEPQACYLPTF